MPSQATHAIPLPKRLPLPAFKLFQRVRIKETGDTGTIFGVSWGPLPDWYFVIELDEDSPGRQIHETPTEVAAALEPLRLQRRKAK
ncbi:MULTISPECIES: hypothetical protein [Trichocoleus]|uniref:Uncharacterized protein n=1 Tax=Trichocoleus desertorum GB2-A4 TaxID=2933944 RepID=A0ABV0JF68_9CYAN|nr:hypothetical protein [Trichocoleus sp. FACHB-46]MBD1862350.1 hypothetical protein [Trichocoleus sp. FACHB-46]